MKNDSHAVPDASVTNVESTTHQNKEPHVWRKKKKHCVWKNDRRHNSRPKRLYCQVYSRWKHLQTWRVWTDCGTRWQSGRSTNHTNAIPSSTVTHMEKGIHDSGEKHIRDRNRAMSQEKQLNNQALWRTYRGAWKWESTWWHTFSRSNAGISATHAHQRWPFPSPSPSLRIYADRVNMLAIRTDRLITPIRSQISIVSQKRWTFSSQQEIQQASETKIARLCMDKCSNFMSPFFFKRIMHKYTHIKEVSFT